MIASRLTVLPAVVVPAPRRSPEDAPAMPTTPVVPVIPAQRSRR